MCLICMIKSAITSETTQYIYLLAPLATITFRHKYMHSVKKVPGIDHSKSSLKQIVKILFDARLAPLSSILTWRSSAIRQFVCLQCSMLSVYLKCVHIAIFPMDKNIVYLLWNCDFLNWLHWVTISPLLKNVLYLIVLTLTALHKKIVKKQLHKLDEFRRVDFNNLLLFVIYCIRAASFILAVWKLHSAATTMYFRRVLKKV